MGDSGDAPAEKKEEKQELKKGGDNDDKGSESDEDDPNNPSCCCCQAGAPEPNALGSNSILERDRCCTDPHMLLVFLVFVAGMFIVADLAWKEGDPNRIQYGTNWQGNTCNTGDLEGYD